MGLSWDAVRGLVGHTLVTITGAPFRVLEVVDRTVYIQPVSSGKRLLVARSELERAYELVSSSVMTPGYLRNHGITGPAGYITGILRAVESVC